MRPERVLVLPNPDKEAALSATNEIVENLRL